MSDPTPERRASKVAIKVALLQFHTAHPDIAGIFEQAGVQSAAGYFALRLLPMGPIPPAQAAAAIPFFPAALTSKMVERVHASVGWERFDELGRAGLAAAAESVYGSMDGLGELTELLETAADGADLEGRPIAAAWSSVEWHGEAARLFGAATVLREHRGDGHFMAARVAGLRGLEMHVLATAIDGRAPDRVGHGLRPDDLEAVAGTLRTRGLLDGWEPTSAAHHMVADIEEATGRLDLPPWKALGADGVARVIELGKGLPKP